MFGGRPASRFRSKAPFLFPAPWLSGDPLKGCSRKPLDSAPSSLAELQGGETLVHAVFNGLQFVVGAGFCNMSAGDDKNPIHVPHGGQPVSDDKRRAPSH